MRRLRQLWQWCHDYPPASWAAHVLVTLLAPVPVALLTDAPAWFVAAIIAALYGHREWVDRGQKIKDGSWTRPGTEHVTGFVDGIVDWGGPLAVAATYGVAALL